MFRMSLRLRRSRAPGASAGHAAEQARQIFWKRVTAPTDMSVRANQHEASLIQTELGGIRYTNTGERDCGLLSEQPQLHDLGVAPAVNEAIGAAEEVEN